MILVRQPVEVRTPRRRPAISGVGIGAFDFEDSGRFAGQAEERRAIAIVTPTGVQVVAACGIGGTGCLETGLADAKQAEWPDGVQLRIFTIAGLILVFLRGREFAVLNGHRWTRRLHLCEEGT